jgi:hypothetical protein
MSIQDTPKPKSLTVSEFREAENMSASFYYKMRRMGLGPQELHVPGTGFTRITPEAHAEWHERMAKLGESKAAELERARRLEQRRIAGAAAAASSKHISRRAAGRKAGVRS